MGRLRTPPHLLLWLSGEGTKRTLQVLPPDRKGLATLAPPPFPFPKQVPLPWHSLAGSCAQVHRGRLAESTGAHWGFGAWSAPSRLSTLGPRWKKANVGAGKGRRPPTTPSRIQAAPFFFPSGPARNRLCCITQRPVCLRRGSCWGLRTSRQASKSGSPPSPSWLLPPLILPCGCSHLGIIRVCLWVADRESSVRGKPLKSQLGVLDSFYRAVEKINLSSPITFSQLRGFNSSPSPSFFFFRFRNVIFDIIPSREAGKFQVKAKFMGIDMENFQLSYQVRGQLTRAPAIRFDCLIIYQLSNGSRLSEAQTPFCTPSACINHI